MILEVFLLRIQVSLETSKIKQITSFKKSLEENHATKKSRNIIGDKRKGISILLWCRLCLSISWVGRCF